MKKRVLTIASYSLPVVLILVVWEIAGRLPVIGMIFPDVTSIIYRAIQLLPSSMLLSNLSVTLYEIGISFVLAVAAGLIIGLLMGASYLIQYSFDPYVQLLLALPKIVIYPLVFFIFGLDVPSKVAFAFLLAVFPFIINTMNGVRNIEPLLIDVAVAFKASRLTIFRKILIPAAMPNIMTAVELSFGQCVLGVILGEVYASLAGIGNIVNVVGQSFDFPTLYVLALIVFVISFAGTGITRKLGAKLAPWSRSEESVV